MKEKIPYWELGYLNEKEPSGYIIKEKDDSHSHWSTKGEWKHNCGGPNCIKRARKHLENHNLITNKITMNKLTSAMKRVLSKNMQAQFKAGFRNGNLELTEDGKKELLEILAVEKEKDLTDVANEILKEE